MKKLKSNILQFVSKLSPFFRELYCRFKRKKADNFLAEITKREASDIFDYSFLSRPLQYYPLFYIQDCNYYGLLSQLFIYCGIPVSQRKNRHHYIYIEHGIITGNFVNKAFLQSASLALTFGHFREQKINEQVNIKVEKIGPYIHYARPILSSHTKEKLKRELGKVLVVFPSHSIGVAETVFDHDKLCSEIELRSREFDTVIVCLYWLDIQKGWGEIYKNENYKIVCAGHRDDLNFLPRLKSILELADKVMTNAVGTHVCYALYLNKPLYVFEQQLSTKTSADYKYGDILYGADSDVKKSYDAVNQIITKMFNHWDMEKPLDRQQRDFLNSLFGFDQIKTPSQLKQIIY